MSGNRKDIKGRVLKTGESQRKDLIYQYRYKDIWGKTQYVYSSNLNELREKEKAIQKELEGGVDYTKGNIDVLHLVERYIALKQNVRYNTKVGYDFVLNLLKKESFSQKCIRGIKVSDAQLWISKLATDGRGYSTLTSVRGVLRPAFQMAFNEDIVRKNPFDFKLTDVIVNDSKKRIALTEEQKKVWMEFVRTDSTYNKYYDEFVVLLHTGMRVSEFCGLTFKDLNFKNRRINVNHQLIRERGGKYYVELTKTESGRRWIAMDNEVYQSLKNMIANRPKAKTEMIVDGYTGFIMLDKNERPKVALHIENEMRWAMKKYNKLYPDTPLPHITPHVMRHTFCTDMHYMGLDVKSLQYFMGHSEARTTMNTYTHVGFDQAEASLMKILKFTTHNGESVNTDRAL
ncbi:MAG: site-specific integrase [Lachnospiraceae bacterium]|nr:site-specific integrase [Lachnospiraceae bacterium]